MDSLCSPAEPAIDAMLDEVLEDCWPLLSIAASRLLSEGSEVTSKLLVLESAVTGGGEMTGGAGKGTTDSGKSAVSTLGGDVGWIAEWTLWD